MSSHVLPSILVSNFILSVQKYLSIMVQLRAIIIVSYVVTIALVTPAACDRAEPSFPEPRQITDLRSQKIHVVSELVYELNHHQTVEEFIDLDEAKSTIVVKDSQGFTAIHIDNQAKLIFNYKPFNCDALDYESRSSFGPWAADIYQLELANRGEQKLSGVIGLWLSAISLNKTYTFSETKSVYSIKDNDYKLQTHEWKVADEQNMRDIYFYFSETSASAGDNLDLQLESIRIEVNGLDVGTVVRLINIISVDYDSQDKDLYSKWLNLPIGYNCIDIETSKAARSRYKQFHDSGGFNLISSDNHIKFETTATKFLENEPIHFGQTIGLDLQKFNNDYQILRLSDRRNNFKIIFNYLLNVQFVIDLRSGACKIETLDNSNKWATFDYNIAIGLKLSLTIEAINQLLDNDDESFFIKKLELPNGGSVIYFEKEDKNLLKGKTIRIIRKYSSAQESNHIQLIQVQLWQFKDDQTQQVDAVYYFNVIETSLVLDQLEVAKLLDVSEECYLNNDQTMSSGKDYQWIDFTYSIPTSDKMKFTELIRSKEDELKRTLYSLMSRKLSDRMNIFNVARMELIPEEDSIIVRMLLLNLPPLEILFSSHDETILYIERESGDMRDSTSSLQQCMNLCQLNKCKTLSYCESSHVCLLTHELPNYKLGGKRKVKTQVKSCRTFVKPESSALSDIFQLNLKRIVGDLQHRNYESTLVPSKPKQLESLRSDLEDMEYYKVLMEYAHEITTYIKDNEASIPHFSFLMHTGYETFAMIPNKITIEQDPLQQFEKDHQDVDLMTINDAGTDYEQPEANFIDGLEMHRFNAIQKDLDPKITMRLFNNMDYNQCSLLCLDSKCGSFSHCKHRKECIISSVHNLGNISSFVEEDLDCIIVQRNYLSKFNRFQNYIPSILQLQTYRAKNSHPFNPAECAHSCIEETTFNCLSFDYCTEQAQDGSWRANCYFRDDRSLYSGPDDSENISSEIVAGRSNCEHYSRSYLADFSRLEYRKFNEDKLIGVASSLINRKSIDQCADICINNLDDCTAFQFCLKFIDPPNDDLDNERTIQECMMVQGKFRGDLDVAPNQNEQGRQQVSMQGQTLLKSDDNCHIFSLRRDSFAAKSRNPSMNVSTLFSNQKPAKFKRSAISLKVGTVIYSITTATVFLLCTIFLVMRNTNERLNSLYESIKMRL